MYMASQACMRSLIKPTAVIWIVFAWLAMAPCAPAQFPDVTTGQKPGPETVDESVPAMFPHSADSRFWISGRMNFIVQANLPFYAQCSGAYSFRPYCETAVSGTPLR